MPYLGPGGFGVFIVSAVLVYVAAPESVAGTVATLLVTVGSITAAVVGIRRHRPKAPTAWWILTAAGVLWSVASVIRAIEGVNDGQVPLADIVSLVGYVACIASFAMFVRGAQGRRDGTLLDSIVVAAGAALIGWMILVVPSLRSDRSAMQHVSDVMFPTLDAVLLSLTIRLVLVHRRKVASAWWLCLTISLILAADLQWALDATNRVDFPVSSQIAVYLLGFGAWGMSALHPSMIELGRPSSHGLRPLGLWRTAALGFTMLLPTLAAVVHPPKSAVEWIVIAVAALLIGGAGFGRSVLAIRENDRFEERLRYQATHDLLTGLPNRWWITRQLDAILLDARTGRSVVGVMHLDLDDLKRVNDTWGHGAGDELMIATAARLRHVVGSDDAIAHLGGGGFAVVVTVPSVESLRAVTVALDDALVLPLQLDVGEVFATACIGVTFTDLNIDVPPALDLLREADTALHVAKATGDQRVVWFDSSMRAQTDRRMELERDLRRAVDRGELRVYYQPIVSLRTGEWVGFEALVRWQHPEQGLVSPGEFIPLAEDTGLIVPIGEFVLREAVRQVAEWRRAYDTDWVISVNLSVRQLRAPGLVDMVSSVLDAARMPVGAVWIELTESMMMLDDAAGLLHELRAAGTRLAMDDFGTGYSSLSYLKRYPIDRVKIDRTFVVGIGDDADSAAIVAAIIGMASALSLECVAEGVETEEQRRRLTQLGCQKAQGFLFSRPVPAAAIESEMALRARTRQRELGSAVSG